MPNYGDSCVNLSRAREALEYCRFVYKMYAQTCEFPADPFYEARCGLLGMMNPKDTARTRLMKYIHEVINEETNDRRKRLDPLAYHLNKTPNPRASTIFGGESENYLFFQPRDIDMSIGRAQGFDVGGQRVDRGHAHPEATARCGYFQGETGQIKGNNHEETGWRSYLGAVIRQNNTLWVSFRGSRSGSGARSLIQAQTMDKGNPDWVTDMQWLIPANPDFKNDSQVASGFYYAYRSCRDSLNAACTYALNGQAPEEIIFTGHSLGGALAQMAYLDMVLESDNGLGTRLGIDYDSVKISCFPISAPPIIKGKKAYHKFSQQADVTSVFHYFVAKDAVHAGPLVTSGAAANANKFVKVTTHPQTHPHHIGSQIVLTDSEAEFPDAHEPREVYKGMWSSSNSYSEDLENLFWLSHNLGLETGEINFAWLNDDQALKSQFLDALEIAAKPTNEGFDPFVYRAWLWTLVAKGVQPKIAKLKTIKSMFKGKVTRRDGPSRVDKTWEEIYKFEQEIFKADRSEGIDTLMQLKEDWQALYDGGWEHRATSSAYLTLMIGAGIHCVLHANGREAERATTRAWPEEDAQEQRDNVVW